MAKSRTYINRRGGVTREVKNGNSTYRTSHDKFSIKSGNGPVSTYITHDYDENGTHNMQKGAVRQGKTEAQIKAQLDRIKANADFLRERDRFRVVGGGDFGDAQERQFQINDRVSRAMGAAKAYSDYQALGSTAG